MYMYVCMFVAGAEGLVRVAGVEGFVCVAGVKGLVCAVGVEGFVCVAGVEGLVCVAGVEGVSRVPAGRHLSPPQPQPPTRLSSFQRSVRLLLAAVVSSPACTTRFNDQYPLFNSTVMYYLFLATYVRVHYLPNVPARALSCRDAAATAALLCRC